MPLPNFFIVGTDKSGTTSLLHYLQEHPDIFMNSSDRPAFFLPQGVQRVISPEADFLYTASFKKSIQTKTQPDLEEYLSFFSGATHEKIVGEVYVGYLSFLGTAERIHQAVAHARLIAILRNPFDAAYSSFSMQQRYHDIRQDVSFLEMLQAEDIRNNDSSALPDLIRGRFYDDSLEQYFNTFPKEQIRVFLYEDLKDSQKLCKEIFSFLEVDETFSPHTEIGYNTSSQSTQNYFFRVLLNKVPLSVRDKLPYFIPKPLFRWYMEKRLGISNGKDHFKVSKKCPDNAKEFLYPIFKPRILRLQDMINRDLSDWLA